MGEKISQYNVIKIDESSKMVFFYVTISDNLLKLN